MGSAQTRKELHRYLGVSGKSESVRWLVAVLDWGWGHLTRTLAFLCKFGHPEDEVLLVMSPSLFRRMREWLRAVREDVPLPHKIQVLDILPELSPHYRKGVYAGFLQGVIHALKKQELIQRLAQWLESRYSPDVILSDSVPGFAGRRTPSWLLTHQTGWKYLRMPGEWMLAGLLERFWKPFSGILIPDREQFSGSLGGWLSRISPDMSIPAVYVGPLSLVACARPNFPCPPAPTPHPPSLLLLGGVSPHREILARVGFRWLRRWGKGQIWVAGWRECSPVRPSLLRTWLEHAETGFAYGGYSTVMDLAEVGRWLVLVPFSGQREQEVICSHVGRLWDVPWVGVDRLVREPQEQIFRYLERVRVSNSRKS